MVCDNLQMPRPLCPQRTRVRWGHELSMTETPTDSLSVPWGRCQGTLSVGSDKRAFYTPCSFIYLKNG